MVNISDNLEAYLACTNAEVDLPEYYEGAPEFKYVEILVSIMGEVYEGLK